MAAPLAAILIPRQSGGRNYYTYSVGFAGEIIVEGSTNPEHDACRAMKARGFTGTLLLCDCNTGKERSRIDIERGAKWYMAEDQRGFRLRAWTPYPGKVLAGTGETSEPRKDTSEAA
jgi:hypothetical protein